MRKFFDRILHEKGVPPCLSRDKGGLPLRYHSRCHSGAMTTFSWCNAHETPRTTQAKALRRGARGGSAVRLHAALHRPAALCASARNARSLQSIVFSSQFLVVSCQVQLTTAAKPLTSDNSCRISGWQTWPWCARPGRWAASHGWPPWDPGADGGYRR